MIHKSRFPLHSSLYYFVVFVDSAFFNALLDCSLMFDTARVRPITNLTSASIITRAHSLLFGIMLCVLCSFFCSLLVKNPLISKPTPVVFLPAWMPNYFVSEVLVSQLPLDHLVYLSPPRLQHVLPNVFRTFVQISSLFTSF